MWAGRHDLTGLRDVLTVPADVRRAVAHALPPSAFALYGISWNHVCAVTAEQDAPYELYFPQATARNSPELLRAMTPVGGGGCLFDRLADLLPPGASRHLPICRDVWKVSSRGRPWRQAAVDIIYPSAQAAPAAHSLPRFPFPAHVMLFSEDAALAGDFSAPLSTDLDVPIRFTRQQ